MPGLQGGRGPSSGQDGTPLIAGMGGRDPVNGTHGSLWAEENEAWNGALSLPPTVFCFLSQGHREPVPSAPRGTQRRLAEHPSVNCRRGSGLQAQVHVYFKPPYFLLKDKVPRGRDSLSWRPLQPCQGPARSSPPQSTCLAWHGCGAGHVPVTVG